MLTCIARSKQPGDGSLGQPENAVEAHVNTPNSSKHPSIKSLTSQVISITAKFLLESIALSWVRVLRWFSAERHGAESVGSVQAVQPLHESESTQEQLAGIVRCGLGPIPLVVPADGKFKLDDATDVGEGDGGEVERDFEWRSHAQLSEWTPSWAGGVCRGERAQGVGRSGRTRCSDYLRFSSSWGQWSETDTIQVRSFSFLLTNGSDFLWDE